MMTDSTRILPVAYASAILSALNLIHNNWAGLVGTFFDDDRFEKNFACGPRKGDFTRSQSDS